MNLEEIIAALRTRQTNLALTGLRAVKRGDSFEFGSLSGRIDEIDQVISALMALNRGEDPNVPPQTAPIKTPTNPYL